MSPQEAYFAANEQRLSALGIEPMYDTQGNYIPLQRQSDVTSAGQLQLGQLKAKDYPLAFNLRNLYQSLSNPRLTREGEQALMQQIQATEKRLGIPSGEIPPEVLQEMSPKDRESLNLGWARYKEQARHNEETEQQGRDRIAQGQKRIDAMQKRLDAAKAEKNPEKRAFLLRKSLNMLLVEKKKRLNPDFHEQLYEGMDEKTGNTKRARGAEIDYYTQQIIETRNELARVNAMIPGGGRKAEGDSSPSAEDYLSAGLTTMFPGMTPEQARRLLPRGGLAPVPDKRTGTGERTGTTVLNEGVAANEKADWARRFAGKMAEVAGDKKKGKADTSKMSDEEFKKYYAKKIAEKFGDKQEDAEYQEWLRRGAALGSPVAPNTSGEPKKKPISQMTPQEKRKLSDDELLGIMTGVK